MKYYVRTIEERIYEIDETYNQIEYEALIDYEHKPIDSFIEQLKSISKSNSILIEDDCILCRDFKNTIENVIKEYKGRVISFFDKPFYYYKTKERDDFSWTQCLYFPKGVAGKIAREMERINDGQLQYDTLMRNAMNNLGIKYISYRPCLVQHKDNNTFIQDNCRNNRKTIFFKDYIDNLGLNYNKEYDTLVNRGLLYLESRKELDK